jgi:glucosyl-dolichyl phosphate glucuronosyltransferase
MDAGDGSRSEHTQLGRRTELAVVSITVLIATHNRAGLLRRTLERLSQQAFISGDEVIVVDNASTDDTTDVIARASASFPIPLHRRYDDSAGKAPALNAAVRDAQGDVLAMTDDDVLVSEDWIENIRRLFSDPSIALVAGRIDPQWQQPAPTWLEVERNGSYGPMSSPLALLHYGDAQQLGDRTAVGANMAVRRVVFEQLGGFDPHLGKRRGTLLCGEDHDLSQRAISAGYRCEYRPELRVRHWVPAERTRFRYFLRWFFWCGITHAVIDRSASNDVASQPPSTLHFLRRCLVGLVVAPAQLISGRVRSAAARAMDVAFAFGYLTIQIGGRSSLQRHGGSSR